jgi:Gene product 88
MKLKFLTQNAKMKKASLKTYNFDIPAGKTCIGADSCLSYCYAMRGFYKMPNVKNKHEQNLQATKKESFVIDFTAELRNIKGLQAVRIHSAGDYYSLEYLNKIILIAELNPSIIFYSYTKSIPLFINKMLPSNFKVIFSRGGKFDNMIDQYNLRSCSVVDEYSQYGISSDQNDSNIILKNDNIELLKRNVK